MLTNVLKCLGKKLHQLLLQHEDMQAVDLELTREQVQDCLQSLFKFHKVSQTISYALRRIKRKLPAVGIRRLSWSPLMAGPSLDLGTS